MSKDTEIEKELISKISEILIDFEDYDKAFINVSRDIVIKKKVSNKKNKDVSILTSIFKEIIKNDVKKNRV